MLQGVAKAPVQLGDLMEDVDEPQILFDHVNKEGLLESWPRGRYPRCSV